MFHYLKHWLREEPERPRGLAMYQREGDRLDMIAWDWLERAWREAPDLVAPMLFGDAAGETAEITRSEAEQIARDLGIPRVPGEQEMMALVDANEAIRRSLDPQMVALVDRAQAPSPMTVALGMAVTIRGMRLVALLVRDPSTPRQHPPYSEVVFPVGWKRRTGVGSKQSYQLKLRRSTPVATRPSHRAHPRPDRPAVGLPAGPRPGPGAGRPATASAWCCRPPWRPRSASSGPGALRPRRPRPEGVLPQRGSPSSVTADTNSWTTTATTIAARWRPLSCFQRFLATLRPWCAPLPMSQPTSIVRVLSRRCQRAVLASATMPTDLSTTLPNGTAAATLRHRRCSQRQRCHEAPVSEWFVSERRHPDTMTSPIRLSSDQDV